MTILMTLFSRFSTHVLRSAFVTALCLSASLQFSSAFAQTIPQDKEFRVKDERAVNLHDLQFLPTFNDISIGSGNFPSKLEVQREFKQVPFFPIYFPSDSLSAPFAAHSSHNFALYANCFPCDMGWSQGGYSGSSQPEHIMTVKAFDGTHSFTSPPAYWGSTRVWTNRYADGASLSDDGDHVVLTTKSGDRITFSHTEPNGNGLGCGGACAVALYAEFSSGEAISFAYDKLETPSASSIIYWYPTIIPTAWSGSRLRSVVNSRGYGLQFDYLNSSVAIGSRLTSTLISTISGFRTGCSDTAVLCGSGTLPQVHYSYSVAGTEASTGNKAYRLTSFQSSSGDYFNYDYDPAREFRLRKIYAPNSTTTVERMIAYVNDPESQYGYFTGRVLSITDALGNTSSYSGGYPLNSETTAQSTSVVTAPNGEITTLHFPGRRELKFPVPDSVTLPGGTQLLFSYDDMFRLLSATDAAGIKEDYWRDERGNITDMVRTPKPGSTEVATTQSWIYPSCTSSNFRICNKPSYTVDARSKRTDYSYDPSTGQILVSLSPADTNNVRGVTRYGYTAFYPAPGVVPPSGMTLSSASLLTSTDVCLSSTVTGTTVDFTYACPSTARSRTSYIYTPSTSSARTNYELQGVVEDAEGVGALACYRYDVVGNRIAETRPLGTASTCN